MPEWKELVRERLAPLTLDGSHEAAIVEEMAQYLEDRYDELLLRRVSPGEAQRAVLEELSDPVQLMGSRAPYRLREHRGFDDAARRGSHA
jgi:hypothetical protein